jgi:excisionase family DNA binding protein
MELMTANEAAEFLRLSISTIRAWTFQRRLATVKLGRRVLYRRQDLEKLVSENLRNTRE